MSSKDSNPVAIREQLLKPKFSSLTNKREYLKENYNLKSRLSVASNILDDLRILRANFTTSTDFTKLNYSTFQAAVKKSRAVNYNTHYSGSMRLKTNTIQPPPYLIIQFKKITDKVDFKK